MKSRSHSSLLLYILFSIRLAAVAQTENERSHSIINEIELKNENSEKAAEDTHLDDQFENLTNNPVDLNTASQDELKSLLMLNDQQILALKEHLKKFGALLKPEELQVIDEFAPDQIRLLLPFIKTGNASKFVKTTLAKGIQNIHQSFLFRLQSPLHRNPIEESTFTGSPEKLCFRYKLSSSDRFRIGLNGEKDAGEDFFRGNHKAGFDFYSGYLLYTRPGLLRQIILGDFSVQAGQGLILWSGFGFGKSTEIMNIKKNPRGVIPYSSADENNYFRGISITTQVSKFKTDIFYSKHALDGNRVSTDMGEAASSFQTSGYHRTLPELQDRHALRESVQGMLITFEDKNLIVGGELLHVHFSKPLQKERSLYSAFSFKGSENLNAGINYSLVYKNSLFFGEAARSVSGGNAIVQGVLLGLHPKLSVSCLLRSYDKNYQALNSSAFGENSQPANEAGSFLGLNLILPKGFTLTSYADFFHFHWLKYQVDAPSAGNDFLLQLSWSKGKSFLLQVRYRDRKKQEGTLEENYMMKSLSPVQQQSARINLRVKLSEKWEWRSRMEWNWNLGTSAPIEKGFILVQDIYYHPLKSILSGSVRYAIFDCTSYTSRIYTYENDVLFSYSSPAFYGKGSRYYLNARIRVTRTLNLWIRYAETIFLFEPPSPTETGLPVKSDFKVQARIQF